MWRHCTRNDISQQFSFIDNSATDIVGASENLQDIVIILMATIERHTTAKNRKQFIFF